MGSSYIPACGYARYATYSLLKKRILRCWKPERGFNCVYQPECKLTKKVKDCDFKWELIKKKIVGDKNGKRRKRT